MRLPGKGIGRAGLAAWLLLAGSPPPAHAESNSKEMQAPSFPTVRQVTRRAAGHILTNLGAWSPDSEWIVYDTRPDPAGEVFQGNTIEMVHARTGEVRVLYTARNGAHCGVATHHPALPQVVFILGPENPTPDWQYGPYHRQGVVVDYGAAPRQWNLDARDLLPPYTPGALRGGSHVHVFSPGGGAASFTYEDHVLARFQESGPDHDLNLRNIGLSVPARPVKVKPGHPRNHDAEWFSVLVARTTANPKPGSDEIRKACEEGWVGTNGYVRPDGSRQPLALAFQGLVAAPGGGAHAEVFIVDIPPEVTAPGDGPLCGTETRAPQPPRGTAQRRLTRTSGRKFPGLQGPRHWLRAAPDGSRIACLMRDDAGVVQLWTVSPNGGDPAQVTRNVHDIASAFTWSPDGKSVAHLLDGSVALTDLATGRTTRLTPRYADLPPRPEACVFSPDGRKIAFVMPVRLEGTVWNQVFVVGVE